MGESYELMLIYYTLTVGLIKGGMKEMGLGRNTAAAGGFRLEGKHQTNFPKRILVVGEKPLQLATGRKDSLP